MRHLEADGPSRPQDGILLPDKAHPAIISQIADFCEDLRRKEAYCLGFIPAASYPAAIARHRLIVALENGEPAGFVLWAKRRTKLRFHQTAVVAELRRLKHATDIVTAALNTPEGRCARTIGLRVAHDLPANTFWQAIGFRIVATQPGGKTWGRTINIYELPVRDRMKVAAGMIDGVLAAHAHDVAKHVNK
jgi:hypothetical protein